MRRGKVQTGVLLCAVVAVTAALVIYLREKSTSSSIDEPTEVIDVRPGEDIQEALEAAAAIPNKAIVRVHPGVYRPARPGQALVYFNARHDGVILEGVGEVVLTAANPDVADRAARSFPAIVNHVVYFGDGVSSRTVLRNFKITGANGFVDGPPGLVDLKRFEDINRSAAFRASSSPIESSSSISKTHEFFCDGGGILVFGRSYPVIENVEVYGNRSSVCGGGASVLHHIDLLEQPVRFRNCVFRDNRAAVSGAAIDVFSPGSWVDLENCLFVGNVGDEKLDVTKDHGFAALSVFPGCRATVSRCTFTNNRSAVDDRSTESTYRNSIFWKNTRTGGLAKGSPYEMDLAGGFVGVRGFEDLIGAKMPAGERTPALVEECFFHGAIDDLRGCIPRHCNRFESPDPDFSEQFYPRNPLYAKAGYRATRQRP